MNLFALGSRILIQPKGLCDQNEHMAVPCPHRAPKQPPSTCQSGIARHVCKATRSSNKCVFRTLFSLRLAPSVPQALWINCSSTPYHCIYSPGANQPAGGTFRFPGPAWTPSRPSRAVPDTSCGLPEPLPRRFSSLLVGLLPGFACRLSLPPYSLAP